MPERSIKPPLALAASGLRLPVMMAKRASGILKLAGLFIPLTMYQPRLIA